MTYEKNEILHLLTSELGSAIAQAVFFFIWFLRLLALRPLLAYCASLG
jgi:hypothetical protein